MAELEISRTVVGDKPGLVVWGAPFGSSVLEVFFECDGDYLESLARQEGRFRCLPRILKSHAKEFWPDYNFHGYRIECVGFNPDTKKGGGTITFISRQVPQLDLVEEARMFVGLMTRRILV